MSSNWDTHGNDSRSSDFNDGADILLANANFKFEDRHSTMRSTPDPVLLLFQKLEARDGDHDSEPRSKRKRSEENVIPRDFGHDITSMRATTVPVVELPPKKRRKSGRTFEIFEGESLSMFMREVVELQGAYCLMALPTGRYPLKRQVYILSLRSLQPIKAGALTAYPNATLAELGLGKSSAESAGRIALFCNQKHSPSLWNVLARQSVLGRHIKHSCEAAAAPQKITSLLDSDSSGLELSMAAEALAGEMEERVSQMHVPKFVWSVALSLVSAAAPAANTFLAEPIQRHHPPSVSRFPWVKISMACLFLVYEQLGMLRSAHIYCNEDARANWFTVLADKVSWKITHPIGRVATRALQHDVYKAHINKHDPKFEIWDKIDGGESCADKEFQVYRIQGDPWDDLLIMSEQECRNAQSSVVIWRKGAEGRVWSGVGGRELDSTWTAAGYTSIDGSSLRHEF
ncbi:hypothetical protein EDB19DRAFT_1831487 [Suillus lakei]|nr:hypothetical protein EDB19DRAFT_1831487 [Suillus lakei]